MNSPSELNRDEKRLLALLALFVYLIGPTSVGKSFIMKIVMMFMLPFLTLIGVTYGQISFGDIIKDRIKDDPKFAERFRKMVASGNLIPTPVAIEIFEEAIEKMREGDGSLPDIIFVDGFCRTAEQIQFAVENGYLKKDDLAFMIEADESTCLKRFVHRCESSAGGQKRLDAETPTFHARFDLHRRTAPELRAMLKETPCVVHEIDGNGDIFSDVAPKIRDQLMPVMSRVIDRVQQGRRLAALTQGDRKKVESRVSS